MTADASRVICSGRGLRFAYVNHPTDVNIDAREAGPGELSVYCQGLSGRPHAEVRDHMNGTYSVMLIPTEPGNHTLVIKYDGKNVPGSPFSIHVSSASLLKVYGPGLHDGIIDKDKGKFVIECTKADPGELKIRVGGPRGAFNVKAVKDRRNQRIVRCKYHPTESGDYYIEVKWMGDHVPGSPFHAKLFRTQDDLLRYKRPGKKR